jgi:hypothetical protein
MNVKRLIYYTFLLIILIISNQIAKAQSCDQLLALLKAKANEVVYAQQQLADASGKYLNINNPSEFERIESNLNIKTKELEELINKCKQMGCSGANGLSGSTSSSNTYQPTTIDKVSNIGNAAINTANNISNIWDDANNRISNIEHQAPSMSLDNGNETAKQIGDYNKEDQANNIFKKSGNLEDELFEEEKTNSTYDVQFEGNCCNNQSLYVAQIRKEKYTGSDLGYYKYYIILPPSDMYRKLNIKTNVHNPTIGEYYKQFSLDINSETTEYYLGNISWDFRIEESKLNCKPSHTVDDIDTFEYIFPDKMVKIQLITKYNELISDEARNELAIDRHTIITNISTDTISYIGWTKILYDKEYSESITLDLDISGNAILSPGSSFQPCVEFCDPAFINVKGNCDYPKPIKIFAPYFPLKTTSENYEITIDEKGTFYKFPFSIIYKSKMDNKVGLFDNCFGMVYDIFIYMPTNKNYDKVKWFDFTFKFLDDCNQEKSLTIPIAPFNANQYIGISKKIPIQFEMKSR